MFKSAALPMGLAIAAIAPLTCAAQQAPARGQPDYDETLRCGFLMTVAVLSRTEGAPPDRSAGDAVNRYISHARRLSGKTSAQVIEDMGTAARGLAAEFAATPDPAASRDAAIAACRANAQALPPGEEASGN